MLQQPGRHAHSRPLLCRQRPLFRQAPLCRQRQEAGRLTMQYPRSDEQYVKPVPQCPHMEQHLEASRHTPVPTAPSPQ